MQKLIIKLFFVVAAFLINISAFAEVYLTKDQALEVVLGSDTEKEYLPKILSIEINGELLKSNLSKETINKSHFFVAKKNNAISGYALIDQEIGKHLPITYIVGITPEGAVSRVEIMVFREVRGWEARERQFLKQFERISPNEKFVFGENLRSVTGATLSCRAISRGVRRALFLWNKFFKENK